MNASGQQHFVDKVVWVCTWALFTNIGIRAAIGLAQGVGLFFFGKFRKSASGSGLVGFAAWAPWLAIAFFLSHVIFLGRQPEVRDMSGMKGWLGVAFLGFYFGSFLHFLNIASDADGLMVFLKPFTDAKGRILVMRRFGRKEVKRIVEDVIPSVINYYGEYTVIEVEGEYQREEGDETSFGTVTPNPQYFLTPFIDNVCVNFGEKYVSRFPRRHYASADWRDSFLNELDKTQSVVVDVSSYSDNVTWELSAVLDRLGISGVVAIAQDTEGSRLVAAEYSARLHAQGRHVVLTPLYYPTPESPDYAKRIRAFRRELAGFYAGRQPRLETYEFVGIAGSWVGAILVGGGELQRVYGTNTAAVLLSTMIVMVLGPAITALRFLHRTGMWTSLVKPQAP